MSAESSPAGGPSGPAADSPPAPLARITWPVDTDRLRLRPVTEADVEAVWSYRRDPQVSRWLGSRHDDPDSFRTDLLARSDSFLVIIERDSDRVVGDLMLRVEDGWAQRDVADRAVAVQAALGWVLDPGHTGRGYAREAVTALLGICFDGLGLRRVIAGCFAANEPSWRLMERLGMRREAVGRRDSLHRDLGWLDGYTYALLAEEWRSARGG